MSARLLAPVGCMLASLVAAQAPAKISLDDAIARAKQYSGQIQSANLAALQAREDTVQARANRLATVNAFNQYIYTEGNGTPSGVFVANDGVHVYNEQAVVHQDLLSLARRGEINRALASEAIAQARVEIAARGLNATVIQDYYAIVSAERRLVNTTNSVQEAERFLDITQKQEKGGEAAHADVIKAQLDLQQRQRDLKDAQVAIDKAKIALGVLIFPNLNSQFEVVDDLAQLTPPVPVETQTAAAANPDVKSAQAGVREAQYEIEIARYQYLPSFALDVFVGIDANQFAFQSVHADDTGRGTLPNFVAPERQNFGYSAQATLNIPVWNWGATRSKVKQAELKRDQAKADLSMAERTFQANLATAQAEAQAAQAQLDSLRDSSRLAAESLRLTVLRYQAGEATALEVVDAQNTLTQSRNAYDDGLSRYAQALANLKSLTGKF
ncbi:MAG TPA: TolC family protein [Bryobacteraceae bacterium]|nr:TolC family protein [Bryobacteraceae bacterium]